MSSILYWMTWDDLSADEKKAYARSMEVFAGFLEHTDAKIGRLVDFLEGAGILDDTIIVFLSDNGTSPEGGQNGTDNIYAGLDLKEQNLQNVNRILKTYDTLGNEYSFPHYPMGRMQEIPLSRGIKLGCMMVELRIR